MSEQKVVDKEKGKSKVYDNLAARSARGDYQLALPIDRILLEYLPKQGELFGGLYPLGETVKNLLLKLPAESRELIDTKFIAARLRVMHVQNLAAPIYAVATTRGKMVWQITPDGTKLLDKWKAEENGSVKS